MQCVLFSGLSSAEIVVSRYDPSQKSLNQIDSATTAIAQLIQDQERQEQERNLPWQRLKTPTSASRVNRTNRWSNGWPLVGYQGGFFSLSLLFLVLGVAFNYEVSPVLISYNLCNETSGTE